MSVAISRLPAQVRRACANDVKAISQIESSVYEFPWTEGIFHDCMNAGYTFLVYENNHELFGYGIMSFADGECHILNLCIQPDYQGIGWGKSLLNNLLNSARKKKSRVAFLEVRVSNDRAFALYHRLGFNEIATRKNYYPAAGGKREHALVLAKVLK